MANSIGEYTLRVDPSVLQSQAQELSKYVNTMRRLFDSVSSSVSGLSNYWEGEASSEYRRRYDDLKPQIEEMLDRLAEHSKDLNSIAAVYTGVETQNADITQDLSSDVIV